MLIKSTSQNQVQGLVYVLYSIRSNQENNNSDTQRGTNKNNDKDMSVFDIFKSYPTPPNTFVWDCKNIINKVDLITELCTLQIQDTRLFARLHQTFMKIDHIWGHKEKLNIIPKADMAKASWSDHWAIKLEIINKSF